MDQPRGFSEYNDYREAQHPPFQPPKTNGKSIAALVLGICAIVVPYLGFIVGIVGIIFSTLSLKEIKRTGEQGKGMAIAGLVCSIIGTAIYLILIALILVAIIWVGSTESDLYGFDTTVYG